MRPHARAGSGYPSPILRTKQADASLEARVGSRVHLAPNGCWVYQGEPDLYREISEGSRRRRRRIRIHQFVYETLRGPIPDGKVLHHACLTPGCCNPDHLVPLTRLEHMQELRRLKQEGRGVS